MQKNRLTYFEIRNCFLKLTAVLVDFKKARSQIFYKNRVCRSMFLKSKLVCKYNNCKYMAKKNNPHVNWCLRDGKLNFPNPGSCLVHCHAYDAKKCGARIHS